MAYSIEGQENSKLNLKYFHPWDFRLAFSKKYLKVNFTNKASFFKLVCSTVNDHFMKEYMSILASDLKQGIASYLNGVQKQKKVTKENIKEVEKEIKELVKEQIKMEGEEVLKKFASPPALTRVFKGTTLQQACSKVNVCVDIIKEKVKEKDELKKLLQKMDSPSYPRTVLKDITDAEMDGYLEKEFQYQLENIKY